MPKVKAPSGLARKIKPAAEKLKAPREPLWKGPLEDGITQSLLGQYVSCKERFRIKVIEGWAERDQFSHRMEYGNMWHLCEEAFAAGKDYVAPLQKYCANLAKRYPLQAEQVTNWYNVCRIQFPVYVDYWKKHPDVKSREPLSQEEKFKIEYKLPSGRSVLLRGKFDSVDLIGSPKPAGIYLTENKAKGEIEEEQLKRQLSFDLQTMFYLVALKEKLLPPNLRGVRYNVIRRPLAGGKHSIRQHQPTKGNPSGESSQEFYYRLQGLIRDEPEWFFMRWKVEVSPQDIERFRTEFLDPCLENLLDDYEWWKHSYSTDLPVFDYQTRASRFPNHRSYVYRLPYGIWNTVAEGRVGELDEYLATGDTLGLTRCTNLFPELTEEE